jgi:hypothetical protein
VDHGLVDVFAYQEALLIEAVFGIALLAMIWVGFRRWLHYKERIGRLTAEQTFQQSAHIERIEQRLKAVEQVVTAGSADTAAQIDETRTNAVPEPSSAPDQL